MRVAVLDIGTNSTRLLIADVDASSGAVRELVRHSKVTRLGDGVDAGGALSEQAMPARLRARLPTTARRLTPMAARPTSRC